ncbi:hypothetical protein ACFL27_03985 [candidate division CSSED10-310 bacterium]|uniref:Uncharacterized protein n=1 Tax=candidate division CSSED10-310 bacterium TaxID=2855610 RepID=A0ABV6YT08_UNCC1
MTTKYVTFNAKKDDTYLSRKELQHFRKNKIMALLNSQSKPIKMVTFMHQYYKILQFQPLDRNKGKFRQLLTIMSKHGLIKKSIKNGYAYISPGPASMKPIATRTNVKKQNQTQVPVRAAGGTSPQLLFIEKNTTATSRPELSVESAADVQIDEQKRAASIPARTKPDRKSAPPTKLKKSRTESFQSPADINPPEIRATEKSAAASKESKSPRTIPFNLYDLIILIDNFLEELDESFCQIVEKKKHLRHDLATCQDQIYALIRE